MCCSAANGRLAELGLAQCAAEHILWALLLGHAAAQGVDGEVGFA